MENVDILIFGATGFTGKFVVKCLAQITKKPEYSAISWGISGRCKDKLQNLLMVLEQMDIDTSKILLVVCDITDQESLQNETKKAKVLINCTGPYTVLGESVIRSCLMTDTHYIDISAEIYQILVTYIKFNKMAEEKNVLIIPACGYASIPANIGLMYLEKHFKGSLTNVECYIELELPFCKMLDLFKNHCLVHYGTWESLVHCLRELPQYIELKRQTFPEVLDPQPTEIQRSFIHRRNKRFWFPYPGPDDDVVQMSQRFLYEKKQKKPIYYNSYSTMPSLFHFILIPFAYLYFYLCRFKCFRRQLWKHPKFYSFGFMSHIGPTEDARKQSKYTFTMNGIGRDDSAEESTSPPSKSISVKVSGIDPGYQTTAVAVVLSAVTLVMEQSKMPSGGVIMSGAAYQDTNIIERLTSYGIKFEVVEN